MNESRILVVDDEPDLREILQFNLEQAGYQVDTAESAEAALQVLTPQHALLLLDVMMGGMSGFQLAELLRRQHNDIPIIFLTAKDTESDLLKGFQTGADDYIAKPFSLHEVLARVKAVLNRTMPRTEASDSTMTFGELSIDTASHTVKVSGEEVSLTPKEFDLLVFLASNKGIALSREKILQKVWNYDYFGEDRTVDTHVKMLRGHLGKCRGYIATVWGIGYKFDPDAVRG